METRRLILVLGGIAVVLVIVLVALLAIVASGCGGGSDEPSLSDFQDQVVNTRDRVDFALSRVTQAQSKDEFLNRMDEASAAIEAAADDLEDVEPPGEDVAAAQPEDQQEGEAEQQRDRSEQRALKHAQHRK